MTTTAARIVPTTAGAKVYRTHGHAFRAAQKLAAERGTGANPLGCSGGGNVAVGSTGRGEYVVYVRDLGWLAAE